MFVGVPKSKVSDTFNDELVNLVVVELSIKFCGLEPAELLTDTELEYMIWD